ncbi:MAG: OmpH family outer membrane protein [Thermoanaerobaculaceae bacterium]|nr:OmpH family outer membrane protein [Thermoanaerobaculaceae bacterium]TAM51648.1 MAG: OmpH family outer membrane protein [Acidobacteriota bacterium]
MSFTRLFGTVLAGLLLGGAAWAQQPEVAPAKIAFVYVQKALASTDEGKARLKDLDEWARPRQDELAKLDKEVNDLKGEIISKQGVASDDAIAELNRKLVAKQREFEDRQRGAKRDFEAKQQAVLKDIGGKLQDVINKYAEANHFTAVFIFNPDQLAYLAPAADITDTVIKLYNERYPLAAKAPAAPGK